MTGKSGDLLGDEAPVDLVDEDFDLQKLASLSLKVIEEIADQEEVDKDGGDGLGSVRVGNIDEVEGRSDVTESIPIGHDRAAKERTLDVEALGKYAGATFKDLQLKPEILQGLELCRFHTPSPIQMRAIPAGQFCYDLILQSKSGTGKTCAFGVILLENIDLSPDQVQNIQAIIISPTREIAAQTKSVVKYLGSFMPGLKIRKFIGGTSVHHSIYGSKSCNVVCGTPGRIMHMVTSNEMDLSNVKVVVLDEADHLMELSFLMHLTQIFEALPSDKQVIAASATYPSELKQFVKQFMKNPYEITTDYSPELLGVRMYVANVFKILEKDKVNFNNASADTKETPMRFTNVQISDMKRDVLMLILKNVPYSQAIIFTGSILRADILFSALRELNFDVVQLTSALSQPTRLKALRSAQSGKCKILVTSDLGSRGLDIEQVDLVINYDLPMDSTTFIHRFGRAGRFGGAGTSISLIFGRKDFEQILDCVKKYNLDIRRLESSQDIKDLANNPERKFSHMFKRGDSVSVHSPGMEGFRELLERIFKEPLGAPGNCLNDTSCGMNAVIRPLFVQKGVARIQLEMELGLASYRS